MKYYVRGLDTDRFIGETDLDKEPNIGEMITVNGKKWIVYDKSIGQRLADELYVKSVHGSEPKPIRMHDPMTGETWEK